MENASKALIIAGAILISILLISIGIMLINSGREVTDTGTASMGGYKIEAFNSKFTMYEGESRKGSEIKNIISAVAASNQTDENKVAINGLYSYENNYIRASQIKITANYEVYCEYSGGYVYNIVIKGDTIPGGPLNGAVKTWAPNGSGSESETTDS